MTNALMLCMLSVRMYISSIPSVDAQPSQQPLDASLTECFDDLISSDVNTTDGYISLYEYEVFVNARYYTNCSAKVIVSESIPQWEAFTLLACHSCLQEITFVDTIPDCCLPFNNSRIAIHTIHNKSEEDNHNNTIQQQQQPLLFNTTQYDWLQRICHTADTAAVEDQCYTFPPTMAPTSDNNNNNNNNNTVTVFANDNECATALVAVDGSSIATSTTNNTTTADVGADGTISKSEFYHLLQTIATNHSSSSNNNNGKTIACTVTNDTTIIDAVYVNLVCASCTYTSTTSNNIFNQSATARFPNLNCCTSTNASISIVDITTGTTTTWLTRICTTISSMITCIDSDTPTITMVPTLSPLPMMNGNNNTNMTNVTITTPVPSPIFMIPPSNVTPTTDNTTVTAPTMVTNISSAPATVSPATTPTAPPNEEISIPTSVGCQDYSVTNISYMIVTTMFTVVSIVFV